MFDFNFNETFEPSINTKEWCLYTHKSERSFSGIQLPGLFQTSNYEMQLIGFVGIFVLEGIATYWSFNEGVIITAILASIFVDLFLAITSHTFQKTICRMRNELVYEDGDRAAAIRRKLKFTWVKQRIFYYLIFASAFFKFFWFQIVYGTIDALSLFILTCFILGALLHITCTGYAIFTFIFNRKIKKEHNAYIDSEGEVFTFDPNHPLPAVLGSIALEEVESGRHKIRKQSDGKYHLYTYGVLLDTELNELIGKQLNSEQKRIVAVEGVRHQMQIMKQGSKGVGKKQ